MVTRKILSVRRDRRLHLLRILLLMSVLRISLFRDVSLSAWTAVLGSCFWPLQFNMQIMVLIFIAPLNSISTLVPMRVTGPPFKLRKSSSPSRRIFGASRNWLARLSRRWNISELVSRDCGIPMRVLMSVLNGLHSGQWECWSGWGLGRLFTWGLTLGIFKPFPLFLTSVNRNNC